jgi:hypothetical protein
LISTLSKRRCIFSKTDPPSEKLKIIEKESTFSGNLEGTPKNPPINPLDAERATNNINELREKEILLCNLGIIEKNQKEVFPKPFQ